VPADEDTSISSTSEDSTGAPAEATTMVVVGSCGDRVQGEACDDGNGVDEDACRAGRWGRARRRGVAPAAVWV